jgi:predicted dienelactone hydrolase
MTDRHVVLRTLAAAVACAVFTSLAPFARAAEAPAIPAGFSTITVPGDTALRGDPANELNVTVWYPAPLGTALQPLDIGPPGTPYFTEGAAAENAPLAAGAATLPLIVVSHGTGGTSMDLSWLCAGLATRGYIVASVTHPGDNALEAPTVAGTTLWAMRTDDLARTIDGVLANSRFGPHVDRARIGAAGFSLGGYTVLALAGAHADIAQLNAYCEKKPTTPVCSGAATPTIPDVRARSLALSVSSPAYRTALAENARSHRDPRVKAVFAIAPALGPAIDAASLGEIAVPVEIVAGFGDPIVPVDDNAIPDALAIPNAQLTILPKPAAHYTFLTDCAPAGRERFAPICEDAGPQRIAVHDTTARLAAEFFARALH